MCWENSEKSWNSTVKNVKTLAKTILKDYMNNTRKGKLIYRIYWYILT